MPPFMPVQSLYASCLEMVFDSLYEAVQRSSSDSVEHWRKLVQSDLHAGIREHLLQIATMYCRKNVYTLLDLLGVLLDKTSRKLDHSRRNDDAWLPVEQCAALYSRLDQCNATGLQELTVKVRLHPRRWGELQAVSAANSVFHRVLRNGLASSLHSLVLCSACDNETLRLLGRHCHNLRHLDVTSSWLVDDNGLRQLCFKDPDLYAPADFYAEHAEGVVRSYLAVQPEALNRCCETLQQVRIQDTNTSEVGVVMLLLFIPNLKSLGGFIYYRNVGDAILSLQTAKPSLCLSLTDLWDTCLPYDKAAQLARAVPSVASLYTRGNCLSSMHLFPSLTALTVDFDFFDFMPVLHEFLQEHGAMLKKLVIVDQNHPLDIATLAELCPSLVELGAKLEGSWSAPGQLTQLATCRIRVGSTEPFTSLLVHAPRLEHLEVSLEEETFGDGIDMFVDSVVSQALAESVRPPCLSTFLMNSECYFSVHTVQLLIATCPGLRLIGDLQLWSGVGDKDLQELAREVRERNLDLTLRYRGNWPAGRNRIHNMLQQQ